MSTIAFDFETELMGPQKLAPPIVCLSTWNSDNDEGYLVGRVEMDELNEDLDLLFDAEDTDDIRVAHNAAFDIAVACAHRPELISSAFDLLASGHLQCTRVREKLLNLTEYGSLTYIPLPDGSNYNISYSLAALVKYHFNENIEGKEGEDTWRLNYIELADVPVEDYPQEARDYAILDSRWTLLLHGLQEERRRKVQELTGVDPFETLNFRCMADFALYLMSCWGIKVDPKAKAEIEKMLEEALDPSKMTHLIDSGVLRPGQPARPYKNGAKDEDGNPKMKKPVKESIDTKKLAALIEEVCLAADIDVQYTDSGRVSAKKEIIEELSHMHPALEEYQARQKLQKLVTTEIPRMNWNGKTAPVVHPGYDVIKETGRTSSFGAKIYPSFNCQNVDPRVRKCFIAREGSSLFSVDFNQMELGTLAQRCIDLFGSSVMADKINAGYDLHSFLGAQIAAHAPDDTEEAKRFAASVSDDPDIAYSDFMCYKSSDDEAERKFWKHYRTLAKPTGLGYPGGLGAKTFVAYAKATYGVVISKEEAEELQWIWKNTFPEMEEYFDFIKKDCVDDRFSMPGETVYAYTTPFGMLRPNANFCPAANGLGLQSPSAEGAILSVIQVVRASLDPSMGSILYGGVRPICFVHDEILGEVVNDDLRHDRVMEICDLMIKSMRQVTPDVNVGAEPALMERWDKRAEPVYDENGKLAVWTP